MLVRRAPPLGDETNGPAAVRFERRLRERLHFHEPLIGQPRLHHRVATIAVAHRVPVRLDLLEQAAFLEQVHDPFPRDEAVEVGERLRYARRMLHPAVLGHHERHLELVPQPDLEVRRVVRRGHLHEARPEPGLDRVIGDDRHRQVDDRQPGDLAHEGPVALVRGIHGHGRVAQQRFGARGGHGDVRRGAALHGIADVVQLAFDIPGFGLLVRQGREAARAPVDYPMAPVNEPLLPQRHEHFPHRPRVGGVEGEPRPRPVAGGTDHLELLENRRAGLAYERPDPRDECLAAEVEAGLPLFRDKALHHVLRGDAGVVGAGEPQRFPAAHPLEPDQHVLRHVVQPLAHVQHRRDVGRGDHDHVGRLGRVGPGREYAALEPAPVQRALHGVWVVLGRKGEPRLGHSL